MGDEREVTLHGRKAGYDERSESARKNIDPVGTNALLAEADAEDWFDRIDSAISFVKSFFADSIFTRTHPGDNKEPSHVRQGLALVRDDLAEGTDPDTGANTGSATQDFRDFVAGGVYSGDPQNDALADLMKAVIDRGSAPA